MKVPAVWHDDAEHKRKFAEAINAIDAGKLSSNAEITLSKSWRVDGVEDLYL